MTDVLREVIIQVVPASVRRRDAFDDDLRRWIKAHTDNRYLPYGSIF